MTKEDAISTLEMYRANNSNYDEETAEAIDIILSMLEEKDKEISELKKGIHSLMQSRRKWKNRYYNLKKKLA